jgi:hypothetical protein
MHITIVSLCPADGNPALEIDQAAVQDTLWAFAELAVHLEHVRVSSAPGQVDIVIFSIAHKYEDARLAAISLCRLACRHSPLLHDWKVATKVPFGLT